MKFSCDKAGLSEAVNSVLPAVSAKSTMAALECILLRVKKDTLTVVGYNTELGITKTVPVAGTEDGEIILGAKLLSEIINRMPQGMLRIAVDDKLITEIVGGSQQKKTRIRPTNHTTPALTMLVSADGTVLNKG